MELRKEVPLKSPKNKKEDMMDWIKCTDRMPPDMEPVIVTAVWRGEKRVETNMYHEDGCWKQDYDSMDGGGTDYYSDDEITHWMPWPEPEED